MSMILEVAEGPLRAFWEDLLADVEATAAEYEESGWDTLQLHPGSVTPMIGEQAERYGLDVLLPDDEFEELAALVETASFDDYEVYSTTRGGVVFLLVVLRDPEASVAVLVPAYYSHRDTGTISLREHAVEEGVLRLYARRLREDSLITFEQDDPELFFPDPDPEADVGAESETEDDTELDLEAGTEAEAKAESENGERRGPDHDAETE